MSARRVRADTMRGLLARARRPLFAVLAFSLAVNLLTLTVPLYLLQVSDRVLGNRSLDTLAALSAAALLAVATLAALEAVRGLVVARLGTWFDGQLSGRVLSESIAKAARRHRRGSVQGLRDLEAVRGFFGSHAVLPLLDLPWTPLFIAVLFLLHPLLGWVTLIGGLVLVGFAALNAVVVRRSQRDAREKSTSALDHAQAVARNADVVEAMGMQAGLMEGWRRRSDEALALHDRANARANTVQAWAKFARLLLQLAVVGCGAWLAVGGQLSMGGVIAGLLLMRRAVAPLDKTISTWKSMVNARDAYRRVAEKLGEGSGRGRGSAPLPRRGHLKVEGVSYRHSGRKTPTLQDVSFEIEPGEVLGLVGPSAAGKSTMARLLVGLAKPGAGRVLLDGTAITAWDSAKRGPLVGYLPQDVELFQGTIARNIARMGEADREAVERAAELAGVGGMIARLPDGYETEIGEEGAALSGGQRQRVGLARALYGDPLLLVLDEPDANLDREGTDALARAIRRVAERGAAVVLITHRPEMLRHADKILMLNRARPDVVDPASGGSKGSGSNAQLALVPRRKIHA